MLGPKARQKIIDVENEKKKASDERGGEASSSSAPKPADKKKKKASVAKLRLPERPLTRAQAKEGQWEVIPEDRPRYAKSAGLTNRRASSIP